MRKYGIFLTVVFLLFWANEGSAQVQWQVLSPMTFTRGTGAPATESLNFSAVSGLATIKLANGDLEDSSVEMVSSSVVTISGQVAFDSSNFNQNVDYLEKEITLLDGQNTLEVVLKGKPGGQVIIQIIQQAAAITPQMARLQTANALRTGDIELALAGFYPNEKSQAIIPALDVVYRNQLADWIESVQPIYTSENYRAYRTEWTDEAGNIRHIDITMRRNESGQWHIISW